MHETLQQQSNINTCTFQVFQEVCFSLKVAAIEDNGHITIQAQNIISIQIHAPFKCSKNFGSGKVAAIEDKGHNTSPK